MYGRDYGGGKAEMGINIQGNLFAHKRPFLVRDYHTRMIILGCASHQDVRANAPKVLQ